MMVPMAVIKTNEASRLNNQIDMTSPPGDDSRDDQHPVRYFEYCGNGHEMFRYFAGKHVSIKNQDVQLHSQPG